VGNPPDLPPIQQWSRPATTQVSTLAPAPGPWQLVHTVVAVDRTTCESATGGDGAGKRRQHRQNRAGPLGRSWPLSVHACRRSPFFFFKGGEGGGGAAAAIVPR